ncbi:hypothetical protein SAMN05660226_03119 [Parapedobacter luteus]|uniref:MOSC domain-containing protein n=1 Tax=Parapedobacter luteus TaxID=623280 RepID=A0A1T5E2X8_9SPHI|nr:MOSC N-terminal beta barrel domain-containing protein [Parapedobacter luteus]SKB78245.1 hypothetical protein SAMN05660226_03119 [Parapedobacter luteus]
MLRVSELYVYPIKSLGGISLQEAMVAERGLLYDRRWMLIDAHHRFLSQRQQPRMALIQVHLTDDGLHVTHQGVRPLHIPFTQVYEQAETVAIWDDTCTAMLAPPMYHRWFSHVLGIECRLVYMPESTRRAVDPRYAPPGHIASFADAYPFLMIGQASLDDLNSRLETPLPINRFRPNIVFTGGQPYEEDRMGGFRIGPIRFHGVKLCARCVITTIDQQFGERGKEPLKTLATYRSKNNKTLFGQNLIHQGTGMIRVGDAITVEYMHDDDRFVV